MSRAEDCIFCDIISGDAEASFVYQDDLVVAFLTIGPVTAGHLMVVPIDHMPQLADLTDEVGARMFNVAVKLAQALRDSGLRCEGINLFHADGAVAFQEVFHSHLHVIPRYAGDSFGITADWQRSPSRAELDTHASLISRAVG
jgi:histidine triad (HIT) family protein